MTGIRISHEMDGLNLIPLINGSDINRSVYSERTRMNSTIIALKNGKWKYIYDMNEDKGMLFNLEEDRYELNELAENTKQKEYFKKQIIEYYKKNMEKSMKNSKMNPINMSDQAKKQLKEIGYL